MTSPVVYFWMGLPIRWKCLSQSVHPWQMNMWKCLLLLVLSPVHLNILSFSLPLFPPRWNIWFSPSRHTQQLILLKLKLLKVTPILLFSLSLSTVHTPPPSFQTRDDFLGQVDVPLSHLPVSYLCLRDRSDCFDTLSYFLSLSEQVFFFPPPSSAWSASLEGQAKVFWLECEKLQASPVECCDHTADSLTRQRKTLET